MSEKKKQRERNEKGKVGLTGRRQEWEWIERSEEEEKTRQVTGEQEQKGNEGRRNRPPDEHKNEREWKEKKGKKTGDNQE